MAIEDRAIASFASPFPERKPGMPFSLRNAAVSGSGLQPDAARLSLPWPCVDEFMSIVTHARWLCWANRRATGIWSRRFSNVAGWSLVSHPVRT
jgi:hypothetical protein